MTKSAGLLLRTFGSSAAALSTAIVEVVLTLSRREVPRAA
jgi:hypothetical protein